MGIPFTRRMGFLFTMTLGIQLTISKTPRYPENSPKIGPSEGLSERQYGFIPLFSTRYGRVCLLHPTY
jgi:hypothetical protein